MKVDGSISSVIQGVSQQPARDRLPGQCTLQENFSSDPRQGLTRRGPTEYETELSTGNTYYFQDYDAGSLGHFTLAHRNGDIKIWDVDGTPYTVVLESGASYLTDSEMIFTGIDDKIYVADPTVEIQKLSGSRTYIEEGALVFALGGQYGRTYKLTIDWKDGADVSYSETGEFSSPDGSAASHIEDLDTTNIMEQLKTDLETITVVNNNFEITQADDILYIKAKDAADVASFSVSVSDGDGGVNVKAVNRSVEGVGDLPKYAPKGYVVTVNESDASADDWYLEFITNDTDITVGNGFGKEGYWVETVAPDLDYQLDATTLPHILEKTGPTEFTFKVGEWADREVGDDTTNPFPSFVGNTVNDMNAFQGRLVLTSDVNVVMSRNNKYTNFFSQSATGNSDDDPIDISSALGTYVMRKIVPHNRDLVIFADGAQFIIFGRQSITFENTSLVLTTEYKADLGAKPVGAGRNIFFAYKYGTYSGIREFFTEGSADINDARSITDHVLQYINGSPVQIVSTTNFNKMLVRSSLDKKTVFIYEYLWLDNRKAQSSWSTWTFSDDVEHMFFVDNVLHVITSVGTTYNLVKLNLDDVPDTGITYRVYLDNKVRRDDVETTFTVPYTIDAIDNYVAVQGPGCPNPGLTTPILSESSGTITLRNNMGGGTVIFGRKFSSAYVPTQPFVRDRDGVKVGSGKLVIKYYVLHCEDTGYIKAILSDDYGYEAEVEFTGRVLGSPSNIVGEPAVSDISYKIPYKLNANTSTLRLETTSHLPFSLLEMEWLGQWTKKGRRITGG